MSGRSNDEGTGPVSLNAQRAFTLRQELHVATISGLMSSRRWEPGELVFQGGTSLHLAHGSPRFSEDLDFIVAPQLNIMALAKTIQSAISNSDWMPEDMSLEVARVKEGSTRNPNSFFLNLNPTTDMSVNRGGPGGVKVKVELYRAPASLVSELRTVITPVRLAKGSSSGLSAFVPTEELSEIYADKQMALADRSYLKARDVFDIHWIRNSPHFKQTTEEQLRVRFGLYPNTSPQEWLEKAKARRSDLHNHADMVQADLQRWLPSAWALDKKAVSGMLNSCVAALDEAVPLVRKIASEHRPTIGGARP